MREELSKAGFWVTRLSLALRMIVQTSAFSYSEFRLTRPASCSNERIDAHSLTPVLKEKSTPASTQEVANKHQFVSALSSRRSRTELRVLSRSSGVSDVEMCKYYFSKYRFRRCAAAAAV